MTEQKVFCPAGNGGEEKIEAQKFELNKKEMKATNELDINFNSCTLKNRQILTQNTIPFKHIKLDKHKF